ncbi:MAG: hypothetical protein ACI4WS_05250 [Oscillospiraceae bacterium]
MTDDKNKLTTPESTQDKPAAPATDTWVDDMKQDLEDYIEEQGIYIRQ